MGLGDRIFRILRANVGHLTRNLRRDADPFPEPDYDPPPGPPPPRARPGRRAELEKHYRALELPYGAPADEVKRAHRALLRRYHPDRFARDGERVGDATRLSQELTEARDRILEALERGET